MPKTKKQPAAATVSQPANALSADEIELLQAIKHCAEKLNAEYEKSKKDSVFYAGYYLTQLTLAGKIKPRELIAMLDDNVKFTATLAAAEIEWQTENSYDIRGDIKTLAINTNWKLAAKLSIAIGCGLSAVTLLVEPFTNNIVQPYADWLMNKNPSHAEAKCEPAVKTIQITNNYGNTYELVRPNKPARRSATISALH